MEDVRLRLKQLSITRLNTPLCDNVIKTSSGCASETHTFG